MSLYRNIQKKILKLGDYWFSIHTRKALLLQIPQPNFYSKGLSYSISLYSTFKPQNPYTDILTHSKLFNNHFLTWLTAISRKLNLTHPVEARRIQQRMGFPAPSYACSDVEMGMERGRGSVEERSEGISNVLVDGTVASRSLEKGKRRGKRGGKRAKGKAKKRGGNKGKKKEGGTDGGIKEGSAEGAGGNEDAALEIRACSNESTVTQISERAGIHGDDPLSGVDISAAQPEDENAEREAAVEEGSPPQRLPLLIMPEKDGCGLDDEDGADVGALDVMTTVLSEVDREMMLEEGAGIAPVDHEDGEENLVVTHCNESNGELGVGILHDQNKIIEPEQEHKDAVIEENRENKVQDGIEKILTKSVHNKEGSTLSAEEKVLEKKEEEDTIGDGVLNEESAKGLQTESALLTAETEEYYNAASVAGVDVERGSEEGVEDEVAGESSSNEETEAALTINPSSTTSSSVDVTSTITLSDSPTSCHTISISPPSSPTRPSSPTTPTGQDCTSSTSIYELKPSPGAGLGTYATSPIKRGRRIISEPPLILLPSMDSSCILPAVASLTLSQRHTFFSLSSPTNPTLHADLTNILSAIDNAIPPHQRSGLTIEDQVLAHKIVFANTHAAGAGRSGIFTTASRINHSCVPNVYANWNEGMGGLTVQAIVDIAVGEELRVSYVEGAQPREERREELKSRYGFECACPACTDEASEKRRTKITKLHQIAERLLTSLQPQPMGTDAKTRNISASLSATQKAIQSMKEEGIVNMEIVPWLHKASQLTLSLGQMSEAANWARKALDVVEVCCGVDSEHWLRYGAFLGEVEGGGGL